MLLFLNPLLGPNILLSALFSDTLDLLCSSGMRNQVSHLYETISMYEKYGVTGVSVS
jgi:hypothetical protein